MTSIAYREGILCSDSATCLGTVFTGDVRKTTRTADGCLVATCGNTLACGLMLAWADSGMVGNPGIDDSDCLALLIRPDGAVYLLSGSGAEVRVNAPFYAIGTGGEIALGAMAMGATAEQAVQIACRYDGASREPVRTLRLEED